MSTDIDLALLAKMLGMTGSSGDGEALTAARLANRLVRQSGRSWSDFIEAFRTAETATEAAAVLLAENTALKAALAEVRNGGGALAPWQDIGATGSVHARAQWALDLHAQGRVWLSTNFEVPFLTKCTTWSGRLTARMQPVYEQIITRVAARTGLTPP